MAKDELRRTLTRNEWVRIFGKANLRYPTGVRDRAMFYFAYYTGMRVGELVNLRYRDVDVENGTFTVPREGKTGGRKLAFPDSSKFTDLLRRWLAVREEWGVDSPYFFCTSTGNRVQESQFYRALQRRAKQAGIDQPVHPHMLRHSYATERIHEGVDVLDLMGELGHKQVKTTMIYLHQENTRAVENMRSRRV
jgi:site-specific recombinase XerD